MKHSGPEVAPENWRGRLNSNTWLLWVLMLALPFPYIANTLGWMTAELGRQPWLIYGLGFVGLYFVLGLLFLYLVGREIGDGPEEVTANPRAEHEETVIRPREEHFV